MDLSQVSDSAASVSLSAPQKPNLSLLPDSQPARKPHAPPKRFVRSQIPDSILHDAALNAAIALLPSNYNFEVHKCVWRVRSTHASRVALQLPEGLLMYSLVLSDILSTFGRASQIFVLGDATYGACCVDDLAAKALNADLLIHFGHSCLVPLHVTTIPCLYVFVEISIDVPRLIQTVHLSIQKPNSKTLVLAGTIQFASAIRSAKPELEARGFNVLIPQSKPLSAGEVLGCTAPKIPKNPRNLKNPKDDDDEENVVVVFVADGRFHLEAIMIANPGVKAFRYDPYLGKLFLEEYDHRGMRESRKSAVLKAKEATNWGVVMGTLGRQGNPRILQRLENKLRDRGFAYTVILMSEISPPRIALFEDSVDAWVQIACPRLAIDWGDAFTKPLLNPFEADIALGLIPGWWDRSKKSGAGCCGGGSCGNGNGVAEEEDGVVGDYPMDYYAMDGGEWNSSYVNKPSRPFRRDSASAAATHIE